MPDSALKPGPRGEAQGRNPKISIFILAHNEEEIIEKTVRAFHGEMAKTGSEFEILVCNDHSTDRTRPLSLELSQTLPGLRIQDNPTDKGFGNNFRFGLSESKGDFVLPVMADSCDDPPTVHAMVAMADRGYDVVVGSRYMVGGRKKRVRDKLKSFLSRMAGLIGHHIFRIPTHDATNSFKLMRRSAIAAVKLTAKSFDISLEATVKLHRLGFKITEVPTVWTDRTTGRSSFVLHRLVPRYLRWWKFWMSGGPEKTSSERQQG